MKTIVTVVFSFFALSSFAQLMDGSLVDEGRKLISKSDFTIYDGNEGVLYYTLAVDRKGKVTSATLLGEGSTVTFTPTRMKARNYLMLLQFEEGTHYPQFHHVRVKVTVKEPVID
jgi:hypothetical protein